MQRCFLYKIDNTFSSVHDLAIGPWCFENIDCLKDIQFIEPFEKNIVLSEHEKCFALSHYLINQDMLHLDFYEKKVFFLQNQIRYLYLIYFLYSYYILVKKFFNIYQVANIYFEEVKKPINLNDSSFLLMFDPMTAGWMITNIIKILYPNHKNWFFIERIDNKINVESSKQELHINDIIKKSICKLKYIINKKFNIFKEVKGIHPYVGILFSLLYVIRSKFKYSNKKSNIFFNNPVNYKALNDLNFNLEEFKVIFNILKSNFIVPVNKESQFFKNTKKLSIFSNFFNYIYDANLQINYIKNINKIYYIQHGSHYATIINHFRRELEYNFNGFIIWGSRYRTYINKNVVNFIQLPSPCLSIINNVYSYNYQKKILWITGVHYSIGDGLEYLYGTDIIKYIQNKLYFYSLLTVDIKQNIFYKTMPNNYDYQLHDLVLSEMPKEQIIKNGLAIDYMYQAKIVVLDYYGTPFYEAMSMNVPVVLCFLESVPFFDEVASSIFQEFKLLKVVHETPQELAEFLHGIYYTDVNAWWNSEKIQNVRKKFLKLYANNENYFIPWLKAILQGKI